MPEVGAIGNYWRAQGRIRLQAKTTLPGDGRFSTPRCNLLLIAIMGKGRCSAPVCLVVYSVLEDKRKRHGGEVENLEG
jgi:hypothetical protein